ncbi:MAG: hypothetical protein HOO86_04480 [Bacteroidales bacterium]|nr:hypothetical protein [Bacteroidales bacterium]
MSLAAVFRNILLVAGTGRNIGKTTLACHLISHFSKKNEIIGLKITSIYPDENGFHGNKSSEMQGKFEIQEEFSVNQNKDTYRMKQAGASRVFFVRVKDECLEESMEALFQQNDKNKIIICESASLRNIITPGLFLMVRSVDESRIKERSVKLFPLADQIIFSNECDHENIISSIELDRNGWKLVS